MFYLWLDIFIARFRCEMCLVELNNFTHIKQICILPTYLLDTQVLLSLIHYTKLLFIYLTEVVYETQRTDTIIILEIILAKIPGYSISISKICIFISI